MTVKQDVFMCPADVMTTLKKDDIFSEIDSGRTFDLLMSDMDEYSPPDLKMTLQDRLQEISMMNEVSLEESLVMQPSGIEASDVNSLYNQFMSFENNASDDAFSDYPSSSLMSPALSPSGGQNDDLILGRLMSVQERLSEVVSDAGLMQTSLDEGVFNGNLVVNIPHEDEKRNIVNNTLNIHHGGSVNLHRMADNPKFARLKKKRVTSQPPLRMTSLPNTPRCNSPSSESPNFEDRKHMEIKLIEALALPTSKNAGVKANVKNASSKAKKSSLPKKPQTGSHTKRKPPEEPLASRMMPVVSKRYKNNIVDRKKKIKDPRLKEQAGSTGASSDPRQNKTEYCVKTNVIDLKLANFTKVVISSSVNTATETVDDNSVIDMNIETETENESETIVDIENDVPRVNSYVGKVVSDNSSMQPCNETTSKICNSVTTDINGLKNAVSNERNMNNIDHQRDPGSQLLFDIDGTEDNSEANLLSLPKVEVLDNDSKIECPINAVIKVEGPIASKEPEREFGKISSKKPGVKMSSCSENEFDDYDDDDRPYHRKLSKTAKSGKSNTISEKVKLDNSATKSVKPIAYKSPKKKKKSHRRKRSLSPITRKVMESRSHYNDRLESDSDSDYSYHSERSDRSDCENMDISNKLSELSNPVPYDIEQERKVRFLSGHVAKGIEERRNIYAGGITRHTSKAELAEKFKRFGKIVRITLHFRDKGDNYAFIVFEEPDMATRAIEEGNNDPHFPYLELSFGGRRRFVGGSYVDFDANNRYLEETEKRHVTNRLDEAEDDFDKLLQLALIEKQSATTTKKQKEERRVKSSEWT